MLAKGLGLGPLAIEPAKYRFEIAWRDTRPFVLDHNHRGNDAASQGQLDDKASAAAGLVLGIYPPLMHLDDLARDAQAEPGMLAERLRLDRRRSL